MSGSPHLAQEGSLMACEMCQLSASTPRSASHCPRCHRSWTARGRAHCTVCHEHFAANSTFERHLKGISRIRCLNPADVGLWMDDRGVWHAPGPTDAPWRRRDRSVE